MADDRIHALVAFGTRPEAIKLAPVIRELLRRRGKFRVTVCATAQHRQMLDQVVRAFRIPVHHDLNVMKPNQKLDRLTADLTVRVSDVLRETKPDVVVVQGDTTTTLATALASFYQRIPVAHVEAGLRTQDRYSPFPEEINRRLATHLSDIHFAPTPWARDNLLREGVCADRVFVTGNTVVDAFLEVKRHVDRCPPKIPSLNSIGEGGRKVILVTAHRRESFGQPLQRICLALRRLAFAREDVEIVYPVHPNPNVRGAVKRLIGDVPRIHLIEPLEYVPFVWLMSQAYLVLTDSGGIQEEMPSLGRPVLVMRDNTERPEAIDAGVAVLTGTNDRVIQDLVLRLLDDQCAYRRFARHANPFGDGQASSRIAGHLEEFSAREMDPPPTRSRSMKE